MITTRIFLYRNYGRRIWRNGNSEKPSCGDAVTAGSKVSKHARGKQYRPPKSKKANFSGTNPAFGNI
jgi:hypothetical protein